MYPLSHNFDIGPPWIVRSSLPTIGYHIPPSPSVSGRISRHLLLGFIVLENQYRVSLERFCMESVVFSRMVEANAFGHSFY
jgi:hypothetical protein